MPDICTYLLFSTHVYISVLLYSPLLLGSILMLKLHSISKIQSNFPAMIIPSCHWSVHPQVFASKLPFWLMYQYWNITTHQLRNKLYDLFSIKMVVIVVHLNFSVTFEVSLLKNSNNPSSVQFSKLLTVASYTFCRSIL